MKVSILVPIYGVEKYIERCAESLFEQTFHDIEYVFVNDCTPDASISILKTVLERYPERRKNVIIVEHDVNKGLGAARNTAVSKASGDFLMHVDSDDYIGEDYVKACIDEQERTNADIVTVDAIVHRRNYDEKRILPNYKTPRELTTALLQRDIPVNVWGRLIRSSLYHDNNISVEGDVNMSEDWNVIPRLVSCAHCISQIHDVYYYYDCRNIQSYTSSYSKAKYEQIWRTIDVLRAYFSGDPFYTEALNYGIMKAISIQTISVAEANNCEAEFKDIKKKQALYNIKYASHLDVGTQIALRIKDYRLLKTYLKFGSIIKQFCKRLKYTLKR